jgi:hypothetical protein
MRKRPPNGPRKQVPLHKFPGASPATQRRVQVTRRLKKIRVTLPPVRDAEQ